MYKSIFPAVLAVAVLATGCESELASAVDQDRIFADYELFYDANDDITRARATFFFGSATGTRLELDGDAGVSFEGEDLDWNPTIAYYESDLTGFREEGTFAFTNTEGATYRNSVTVTPTDFPGDLPDLDRDGSYEVAWDGPALDAGQSISLSLLTSEVVGNDRLFLEGDEGATKIILPKADLEKLTTGEATLVMDRFETYELEEATAAGGKITGHYRADNATVEVTE